MKKFTTLLFALLLCFISAFSVACKNGETTARIESVTETQIVMSIEETDGKATAFDALKSLRNQDIISFDYVESSYGAYITSINGKAEYVIESTLTSSKGYSWKLYTSDLQNAYEEKTVEVSGTTCGESAFGASSLTVKTDKLYVWVFEYYEYTW
ncbi:MAG: hypothetical protein IJW64_04065 [Clostridia bacterium]|nr:hypothetical protein [Clostridia bacterium]MBQ7236258.1 hypothetical protein [Clostridia bacterium]MBQ7373720.1 hypothetical protein [Clostridia bacterium]